MIIKKIEIKGFGKFQNKILNLNSGVQVIYGKNEAGKSTLMNFIKIMLYSRRKGNTTSSEDKIIRAKYFPWNGNKMCGAMEFFHEGSEFRLQKEIDLTSVLKDNVTLYNKSLAQEMHLGKRQEVGEYLFSLDINSFERSSFIENIGKSGFENVKTSEDTILNKILNISQTGDSDLSAVSVINRINNAIKDLEKSRSKTGKVQILESQIDDLKTKINSLNELEKENSDFLDEALKFKNLMKQKNELEEKVFIFEKSDEIEKLENLIKKIKLNSELENNFGGIYKLKQVIENANQIKNEIEVCKQRILQQKNVVNLLKCTEVKNEEVEYLSNLLKKKEILKEKIYSVKKAEISPSDKTLNFDFEDENIKNLVNNLNLQENKLNNFLNKQKNNEDLDNLSSEFSNINLKQLKNQNLISMLVSVVILTVFFAFFPKWILYIGLSIFGYNIYRVFVFYKAVKAFKLKKEINIQSEKNTLFLKTTNENIQKLKFEISRFFEVKRLNLEKLFEKYENEINEIFKSKGVSCEKDFYEKFAKSQNFLQNKKVLEDLEEKHENLISNFMEKIAVYKKFTNFLEALDFLKFLISQMEKIYCCKKEIVFESKILKIEDLDLILLEQKLKNLKLKTNDFSENKEKVAQIREKLENLKSLNLENSYIDAMKKVKLPEKNIQDLKNDLEEKNEKLLDAKNYLESLKLASKLLEESSFEIRKNFNPKLNKEASKIFENLTGGKYQNVYIQQNYGILVEYEMMQRNLENLSSGTIDQAYLSLRMAISKLISKGKLPLILDDTLVRYDFERMKNTFKFLSNDFEIPQTIVFTCHKYIVDVAKEFNIPVITI